MQANVIQKNTCFIAFVPESTEFSKTGLYLPLCYYRVLNFSLHWLQIGEGAKKCAWAGKLPSRKTAWPCDYAPIL